MQEHSLYERMHPNRSEQAFGMAFGRITKVYEKERLCEVVTFMGTGSMNDQYIPKCQWLNLDSSPEGDETTIIPRANSMGIVFWIDGEPFIFGFFKPLFKNGSALQGNEPKKMLQGDRVIATIAGNRITVKASGLIELFSKNTLQRLMIPTDSAILDLCRKYDLKTDGGAVAWASDPLTQLCLYKAEYRRDLLRSFIVFEERGGLDATTIYRDTIGPAIPGTPGVQLPVYQKTIEVTGKTTTTVTPPVPPGTPIGFKSEINPDGSITISCGPVPNFSFTVSPLGDTELAVNALSTMSISATGDLSYEGPVGSFSLDKTGALDFANAIASISVSSSGVVEVDGGTSITAKDIIGATLKLANGMVGLGGPAAELLDLVDKFLDVFINNAPDIADTAVGPAILAPGVVTLLIQIKVMLSLIKGGI